MKFAIGNFSTKHDLFRNDDLRPYFDFYRESILLSRSENILNPVRARFFYSRSVPLLRPDTCLYT